VRRTKLQYGKYCWATLSKLAAGAIFMTGWVPSRSLAQQPGQRTFSSQEEAANALVAAALKNDEKAMLEILGPDGKQIVSSGDEVEDAESHANFARRYQEMHRVVRAPDGTTVIFIRAHDAPAPTPRHTEAN